MRFAGSYAALEPLDADRHAAELFAAGHGEAAAERIWTWLWSGPFADQVAFTTWLRACAGATEPMFFAIREHACGRALGMAAFLNVRPREAVLEIGHIWFASALQRTAAATEAMALLLRHAFDDLGYRRVEWKCDAFNGPSRRAALRLGFRFEGIFYRHMIVKGRNRDTAWFSLLAEEWPLCRANLEVWLACENFDAAGQQRQSLSRLNGIAAAGPP